MLRLLGIILLILVISLGVIKVLFVGIMREKSGAEAASELSVLTGLSPDTFSNAKFAIHDGGLLGRGGPIYYRFVSNRSALDELRPILHLKRGSARPLPTRSELPGWWRAADNHDFHRAEYYEGKYSRELWFYPDSGEFYIYNTEGS